MWMMWHNVVSPLIVHFKVQALQSIRVTDRQLVWVGNVCQTLRTARNTLHAESRMTGDTKLVWTEITFTTSHYTVEPIWSVVSRRVILLLEQRQLLQRWRQVCWNDKFSFRLWTLTPKTEAWKCNILGQSLVNTTQRAQDERLHLAAGQCPSWTSTASAVNRQAS